jgi:putative chitinase
MITLTQLIACGIGPSTARVFLDPLNATCDRFGITTTRRIAMFIAQAGYESIKFTHLEEDLYYSTPIRILQVFSSHFTGLADAARFTKNPKGLANKVYANRNGNGDEASGDGWKYRGGGLFQLTGKANYLAAEQALDVPYTSTPELVRQPEHATLTAGWYWSSLNLNVAADQGDSDWATRSINGRAMLGKDERRLAYNDNLVALKD